MWDIHKSSEDHSVNFTKVMPDGGMLEARFVRRCDEYFIVYVSSHTGCRHACRFCHLTQTGQTMFTPASLDEIIEQINVVVDYYEHNEPPAKRVHLNFMARGDALSSDVLMTGFDEVASHITARAQALGLELRINISTIFPTDSASFHLPSIFAGWPVYLFWSLYSLQPVFRRRWLPRAQPVDEIVLRLQELQRASSSEVVFHWAFIEGHNDDLAQVRELADWITGTGLRGRFNLVRYNPHNPACGQEPDEDHLKRLFAALEPAMRVPGSRIVPRVGFDVAASCGMFLQA